MPQKLAYATALLIHPIFTCGCIHSPNLTSITKNGQYQAVKNFAALSGVRNVQKGAQCLVGSRNKLGDAVSQSFGCMKFKSKVLV